MRKLIILVLLFSWGTSFTQQQIDLDKLKGVTRGSSPFNFIYHISDYLFNTRIINQFPEKFYYKYPYEYSNSFSDVDFYMDNNSRSPLSFNHLFQIDFAGIQSKEDKGGWVNFKINYQDWAGKSSLRTFSNDSLDNINTFTLILERKTYSLGWWDSAFGLGYNGSFDKTERLDNLVLSFHAEIFPFNPLSISSSYEFFIGQQSAFNQNYTANLHYKKGFVGFVYNITKYDEFVDQTYMGARLGFYY